MIIGLAGGLRSFDTSAPQCWQAFAVTSRLDVGSGAGADAPRRAPCAVLLRTSSSPRPRLCVPGSAACSNCLASSAAIPVSLRVRQRACEAPSSASTVANRAQSSSTRTKSRMVTASLSTAVAKSKSGEGAMRSLTYIRRNYESPSEQREVLGRRLSDRHAHIAPSRRT